MERLIAVLERLVNAVEKIEQRLDGRKPVRTTKAEQQPLLAVQGLNAAAWDRWMAYRTESRMRRLMPKSIQTVQLWLVEQGGDDIQAAIIDKSIRCNWTGLFPLKETNEPATPISRAKRVADRLDAIARADIESRGGITQTLGGGDLQTLSGEVREQVDDVP